MIRIDRHPEGALDPITGNEFLEVPCLEFDGLTGMALRHDGRAWHTVVLRQVFRGDSNAEGEVVHVRTLGWKAFAEKT